MERKKSCGVKMEEREENKYGFEQETGEQNGCESKFTFIAESTPFQDTYLIDHRVLPYIFRFNYAALQKLRMSRAADVPPIAHEIFYYLKDKLITGRFSEGSRFPNRMKYEQKIKFVMRAFDHGYAIAHRTVIANRCQHFNKQSQVEFFQRPEVKQEFLQQIQSALRRKKQENERRIRYLQRYIQMSIDLFGSEPEMARQIFDEKVKRRQLPWTDNMFMDISEFSRILYVRFTKPKLTEQRRILQMGLGQDGQWQMTQKMECSFQLQEQLFFSDESEKRDK